jgi:hypothetical protein
LEGCAIAGFQIKPVGGVLDILEPELQQQIASTSRIVLRRTIGEVAAHVSTRRLVSTELAAAGQLPDHVSPFERPPNTEISGEASALAPASSAPATHCWTAHAGGMI